MRHHSIRDKPINGKTKVIQSTRLQKKKKKTTELRLMTWDTHVKMWQKYLYEQLQGLIFVIFLFTGFKFNLKEIS